MLKDRDVDHSVWPYAMETAAYLRNRVPTSASEKTPFELMFQMRPPVEHLRVFGCKVTALIEPHKRNCFDETSEVGIFVGYSKQSKAWRVLGKRVGGGFCVYETPHVTFFEDQMAPDFEIEAHNIDIETLLEPAIDVGSIAPSIADDPVPAPVNIEDNDDVDLDSESESEEQSQHDLSDHDDDEGAELQQPRYPVRDRRAPHDPYARYVNAVQMFSDEPVDMMEARKRPDAHMWEEALNAEVASLKAMGVYVECQEEDVPRGQKPLPSKGVLKVKRNADASIDKYKYRLVAKGFKQIAGLQYSKVFAPTAQSASFRLLVALATCWDLKISQIDVKTAFLYDDLEGEVYMRMPPELGGGVVRLLKTLYGLKQAARAFHKKLREEMEKLGAVASQHDPCLFYFGTGRSRVYVLVHVDDCLIVGISEESEKAKAAISSKFDIKDMGEAKYFLAQEIERNSEGISVHQKAYAERVLSSFGMENCAAKATPMEVCHRLTKDSGIIPKDDDPSKRTYAEIVGSLMFLAVNTRPDLSYAVGVLSRFMSKPTDVHFTAAKRVLRYLKGKSEKGLFFPSVKQQKNLKVQIFNETDFREMGVTRGVSMKLFADADFAGDHERRRSTSGMLVTVNGTAVSWGAKLQTVVATSTAEAEYIAAAMAVKEALWFRKLMNEMYGYSEKMMLYCDNQSAIHLMTEHTAGTSGKTKHIDVQYHFVQNRFQRGDIDVKYISTEEQKADIFTKAMPGPAFKNAVANVLGRSSA